MSRPSSIVNSLNRIPTAGAIRAEHQITLVDAESARVLEPVEEAQSQDTERRGSDATASQPATPGPSPLSKKLTGGSLQMRQEVKRKLTERKYAKYTQQRYDVQEVPPPPEEDPASQPQHPEPANALQTNYLERSRAKAKALLKRKKGLGKGKDTKDTIVDVLYENQRGVFLFGIPKYSSSSLLPSDPKPWQNAQFRTSPVDIRNAQVPDPSWEWAWKSWYVDMSRDVDEEGWEYSLKFLGSSSWHGNHPWFHSFVRRRRWLRMRRRRDLHHHTVEKSHELTPEYFTIHPKTLRPASEDFSRVASSEWARWRDESDDEPPLDEREITDISQLMQALKKAAVDREKLVAVGNFIEHGQEELYYLPDRIPEIMSLFMFQSSRRQLLTELLHHFSEAHEERDALKEHVHDDDEEAQKQHDAASRHAENLMRAVEVANEQVKKLEYWSDIKGMAQKGETLDGKESEGTTWDKKKWAGLTSPTGDIHNESFASKQDASRGVPDLHKHAEHDSEHEPKTPRPPARTKAESRKSSPLLDALFKPIPKVESTDSPPLERFTTAPESASEIKLHQRRSKEDNASGTGFDGSDDVSEVLRPPSSSHGRLDVEQSLGAFNEFAESPMSERLQFIDPAHEDEDATTVPDSID